MVYSLLHIDARSWAYIDGFGILQDVCVWMIFNMVQWSTSVHRDLHDVCHRCLSMDANAWMHVYRGLLKDVVGILSEYSNL